MAYWEKTGRMPERLANAPALPAGLEYLWNDFTELHVSRGSTGFGAARITYQDLDSWQRVTGARLECWEIDAIRRADNAYLASLPKGKANG